ncbi:hypothetical protein SAMN05720470_10783 [Fibrobacter sp. UWOV1]|nr:hypothetical protein SAMN05720470_10783 [Fibrobacter sp. UWOV1]
MGVIYVKEESGGECLAAKRTVKAEGRNFCE